MNTCGKCGFCSSQFCNLVWIFLFSAIFDLPLSKVTCGPVEADLGEFCAFLTPVSKRSGSHGSIFLASSVCGINISGGRPILTSRLGTSGSYRTKYFLGYVTWTFKSSDGSRKLQLQVVEANAAFFCSSNVCTACFKKKDIRGNLERRLLALTSPSITPSDYRPPLASGLLILFCCVGLCGRQIHSI